MDAKNCLLKCFWSLQIDLDPASAGTATRDREQHCCETQAPHAQGPTPRKGKLKEPPSDWQRKRCIICGSTPLQPSVLDLLGKRLTRKWSGAMYSGKPCWWCLRFVAIRYAHLNAVGVQKFIAESPSNLLEAKMGAFAYLSLRAEGKTQLTTAMLEVLAWHCTSPVNNMHLLLS